MGERVGKSSQVIGVVDNYPHSTGQELLGTLAGVIGGG